MWTMQKTFKNNTNDKREKLSTTQAFSFHHKHTTNLDIYYHIKFSNSHITQKLLKFLVQQNGDNDCKWHSQHDTNKSQNPRSQEHTNEYHQRIDTQYSIHHHRDHDIIFSPLHQTKQYHHGYRSSSSMRNQCDQNSRYRSYQRSNIGYDFSNSRNEGK